MPMLRTRLTSSKSRAVEYAVGLHHATEKCAYYFDQYPQNTILVGRKSRECDIQVKARKVSKVHLVLERLDRRRMQVRDAGSSNGTYIDGHQIHRPVVLLVGMQICIGDTILVGIDATGAFPMTVYTIGELCYRAIELYGSGPLAETYLGMGQKFIRKHAADWKRKQVYGT